MTLKLFSPVPRDEGGMGAVNQGIDLMIEGEVAIKLLKPPRPFSGTSSRDFA